MLHSWFPSNTAVRANGISKGTKTSELGSHLPEGSPHGPECPRAPCHTPADMPWGCIPKKTSEKKCRGGKIQADGGRRTAAAVFIPLTCNVHPPHLQSCDGHTVGLHRRPPRQPWGGVRGRHGGVGEGGVDEAFVGTVAVPGRAGRLRPLLQGQLAAGEVQLPAIPKALSAGHIHLLLARAPRGVVLGHHDERGHAGVARAQRRGVPQCCGGSAAAASGAAEGLWGELAAGDTWQRGGTNGFILAMLWCGDVPENTEWVSQALQKAGFPAGHCATG